MNAFVTLNVLAVVARTMRECNICLLRKNESTFLNAWIPPAFYKLVFCASQIFCEVIPRSVIFSAFNIVESDINDDFVADGFYRKDTLENGIPESESVFYKSKTRNFRHRKNYSALSHSKCGVAFLTGRPRVSSTRIETESSAAMTADPQLT